MLKKVNFKGSPVTLVGRNIKENTQAPDFRLVSQDLKDISLKSFSGKIKIITSFLSLDTPVCDLQVKEFNKSASGLSGDVVILGVSKDLPFAQKRFCQMNNIQNVITLSDYKYSSFGINYGLLIKEMNLIARAVMILDKNNIIRYIQIADELTNPPDYREALDKLSDVIKNPNVLLKQELPGRCKPCEGGVLPLTKEKIDRLVCRYTNWQIVEDRKIVKEFKFKDFVEAKYFLDLISVIAEDQGHHPAITIIYNKVKITLTTHAANGLTDNDFIMAKIIDEIGVEL